MKFKPLKNIKKGADVLFVGINPHPGSYKRGIPFSNNKLFWYLLAEAGFLPFTRRQLSDDKFLKYVFESIGNYNISFVNIIDRPTNSTSSLIKGEEIPGIKRLLQIIKNYKPRIVVFVGKITYKAFSKKDYDFGWQQDLFNSKVYVMHFPTRGPKLERIADLLEIKRALNTLKQK
jgi:TDG/mug DNA glycosylase family protein